MNKYTEYKLKKRSRKRKASEGMTAAILLIAFIITAAGIAFVILTMGSEFQLELGNVGQEGKDAASSAIQVEGGIVTGFHDGTSITAFAFNLKLVLSTGKVDLAATSMEISISIDGSEEVYLTENNAGDNAGYSSLTTTDAGTSSTYDLYWYDHDNDAVMTPNEMCRIYINADDIDTDGAEVNDKMVIVLTSGVATLKIEKTIPIGIVAGVNVL